MGGGGRPGVGRRAEGRPVDCEERRGGLRPAREELRGHCRDVVAHGQALDAEVEVRYRLAERQVKRFPAVDESRARDDGP